MIVILNKLRLKDKLLYNEIIAVIQIIIQVITLVEHMKFLDIFSMIAILDT